jgi:hypothetical protein
MKKLEATKVESTGDDKVYLPTERIGVLKHGDMYYVFEEGDERLMNRMLSRNNNFSQKLKEEEKAMADEAKQISDILEKLEADEDISKEEILLSIKFLLKRSV